MIDLNGHTLSAQSQAFNLYSGTMTIKNGTIDRTNTAKSSGRFITVGHHAATHGDGCKDIEKATLNLYDVSLNSTASTNTSGGTEGQVIYSLCKSEVNLYNCSFKIMMANGVYANHIDVYNAAKEAIVNVYEGTAFYGDPTWQAFKNQVNVDWKPGAGQVRHVFIPEGYELAEGTKAEGDTYAWYTVVKSSSNP